MKKIVLSFSLLLALCLGIVLNSCEKDKDKGSGGNTNPTENPFVGKWRWTHPDPEDGRTGLFTFNADKSYHYVFSEPEGSHAGSYSYVESTKKIIFTVKAPHETIVENTYNFTSSTTLVLIEIDVEGEPIHTIFVKE